MNELCIENVDFLAALLYKSRNGEEITKPHGKSDGKIWRRRKKDRRDI